MNVVQLHRIRRTALGLAGVAAVVSVLLGTIAPSWIVQPIRKQAGVEAPDGVIARFLPLSTGVTLPVWAVQAKNRNEPRAAIILLPGITDSKASQAERALAFAEDGFDAITIDHRAHGDNAAPFATFGFFEKYDLRSRAELLIAENPSRKIGL